MSAEKTMPRHEGEENRIPGLSNLREILNLSAKIVNNGKTHKGIMEGDVNAVFVGAYEGNKYQVKYRVFGGGDFEECDITGQDIGVTIFYGHLVLPNFSVTVDYYFGKRDIRKILNDLKPVTRSVPKIQPVELQPISKDDAPIGILAILGGAHYIFARTYEEAGGMYAAWCEDNEDFDNMRRALTDSNSPIPPFAVRSPDWYPYYLKAAQERTLRQSQEIKI